MSYNDYLLTPTKKNRKTLRVNDFLIGLNTAKDQSVLPINVSPATYNFDFSSGVLIDGYGLKDMGFDTALIENVWRYSPNGSADEEILMFSRAGYIYYVRGGKVNHLSGVQTSGKIFTSNYRLHGSDVVVIFSESSPLIVWDGVNAAYTVTDSPRIKSMDYFEGLMFIADADGETIRYTSDLDPTNWNGQVGEGGSLSLADGRGRVSKLVSFLNYLYVFRDYGISRIAIKDGEPASAGLYVSSGRIYGDTVCLCGNKIVFLAEDGLYEFDGLSTKKVLDFLDGFIIPDKSARATYQGGRYYIACRASFDNEKVGCEKTNYVNNALISYSLNNGGYSISRGMDITELVGISGGVCAVSNGKAARLSNDATYFGEPLKKVWKSPFGDLNSEKVKHFKEINIESEGDIILSLSTENGSRMVLVKGLNIPQRVRFNLRGKKVCFGISSLEANSYIARPTVVYTEA